MNPVTFNEPLKKHVSKEAFDLLMGEINSPLIVIDSRERPDITSDLLDERGIPRLPFDSLRCSFEISNQETQPVKGRAWVFIKKFNENQHCVSLWIKFDSLDGCNQDYIGSCGYFTQSGKPDQWFGASHQNRKSNGIPADENTKQVFVHITGRIASDFHNPHLHLTKVSPAPRGHSVLWQKQREHYVFIHKDHPANKKENKGKKLVVDGCTIDRMSHSRRAHFRLLKSPKFTKKQGQKVWVKSAWCGPTEWTDRSGQIYKIIEKPSSVGTAVPPESAPRPPVS